MMKSWIPGGILLIWVVLAIGDSIFSLDPNQVDLKNILAAPNPESWLGNDDLGRPVLDRMVVGARTSLVVAILVVSISLAVGTVVGALSAWWGRVGRPSHCARHRCISGFSRDVARDCAGRHSRSGYRERGHRTRVGRLGGFCPVGSGADGFRSRKGSMFRRPSSLVVEY